MDSSIWRRAFDGSEAGWPSDAAGFCAKRIPVQIAIVADERDRPRITLAEVDIMEVNKANSTPVPLVNSVVETRLHVAPELTQAVKAVNGAKLFGQDSELSFLMDRESKRFVVRLVDKNTGKVIRQIPAETILRQSEGLQNV
jgi:uncharacterized FlaG/YvyC family protein